MLYYDFFKVFYISRAEGGLLGNKSQAKIVQFFFENSLKEGYFDDFPMGSFDKWFGGDRSPGLYWGTVTNHYDKEKLEDALRASLNDSKLCVILDRFEITLSPHEAPDKALMAKAIAAQFKAIADGGGNGLNVFGSIYKTNPDSFIPTTYTQNAKNKYQWVKIPGRDEILLEDVFVCNDIGTSEIAFPQRRRGNYIENATLDKIRSFDRRGEIKNAFIIGACGYGKTLMMQHLFLEAIERQIEAGTLPVFIELRNYSTEHDDFVQFITDEVSQFDENFSEELTLNYLRQGKVQLLLDGFDELNSEEIRHFKQSIRTLCNRYQNNQIIISSRQCSDIDGIRGFSKLYLNPLNEDQATSLIEKLLKDSPDDSAEETVMSFMDNKTGFVRKDSFVSTNPMLLTIMAVNYDRIEGFSGKKEKFYELLYKTLVHDHDNEKEAYGRLFRSVTSSDDFTAAFRELCALAYIDGVTQFDYRSFESYFKRLKTCIRELSNPSIFNFRDFLYDACSTSCMMYEQESEVFYIDLGFQDFFSAEYFYFEDPESLKRTGSLLSERSQDSFRNLDALRMLYGMSKEKVETCFFRPCLDRIFKGATDTEAFINYLEYGFREIAYSSIDRPTVDQYLVSKGGDTTLDMEPKANHIDDIVLGYIHEVLNLPNAFIVGSMDELLKREDDVNHLLFGYYTPGRLSTDTGVMERTLLKTVPYDYSRMGDSDYLNNMYYKDTAIRDEEGKYVCFGYEYTLRPKSLLDNEKRLNEFMDMCMGSGIFDAVSRLKEYYENLIRKQKECEY